jgi:hypothetical protein
MIICPQMPVMSLMDVLDFRQGAAAVKRSVSGACAAMRPARNDLRAEFGVEVVVIGVYNEYNREQTATETLSAAAAAEQPESSCRALKVFFLRVVL